MASNKTAITAGEHVNSMLAEMTRVEAAAIGARSMGSQISSEIKAIVKLIDEENIPEEAARAAKYWLNEVSVKCAHLVGIQRAKVFEHKGAMDALDRVGSYLTTLAYPDKLRVPTVSKAMEQVRAKRAKKKARKKSGKNSG